MQDRWGVLCFGGVFLACSKSYIITLLEKANGSDFSIKLDCVLEQGYMILAIGATLILELIFVLKPIWQHFDSHFWHAAVSHSKTSKQNTRNPWVVQNLALTVSANAADAFISVFHTSRKQAKPHPSMKQAQVRFHGFMGTFGSFGKDPANLRWG